MPIFEKINSFLTRIQQDNSSEDSPHAAEGLFAGPRMFELEQRVLYDASPLTAVMQPNALDVVDPIDIADLVIEESVADGSLNLSLIHI